MVITRMFNLFLANKETIFIMVVCMVCALIGFLGFIKPYTFDKIRNKYARKSALYFSSIFLAFVATAIAFWVKDWNFVYYWYAGIAFSVCTTFTYSLYEGTNLKVIVDKISNKTWKRLLGVDANSVEELKNELNKLINSATKKNNHDKELDNL